MLGQLYIKHEDDSAYSDAYGKYGVVMGDGFVEAVDGVPPLKDYVTFTSRLMPGRDLRAVPVTDGRDVTLTVHVFGIDADAYRRNKDAFLKFLADDPCICLKIPRVLGEEFVSHLTYTGKGVSYAETFAHNRGTLTLKFVETDPTNRGGQYKTQTFLADENHRKLFAGNSFLVP